MKIGAIGFVFVGMIMKCFSFNHLIESRIFKTHLTSARGLSDLPNEVLEKIVLNMKEYKIGKEAKNNLRLASKRFVKLYFVT